MITTTMKYVKVSVDKKRTELAQAFNNINNLEVVTNHQPQ
jgi:hypothetical protein